MLVHMHIPFLSTYIPFPSATTLKSLKIFLSAVLHDALFHSNMSHLLSSGKSLGTCRVVLPHCFAPLNIKLWTSVLETPVHISPRTTIYSLGWMGTSVLPWFYQPVMLGDLIPATPTGDDPNIINSLTLY